MVDTKGDHAATPKWLDNSGQGDLLDSFTDQEVALVFLADIDYEAQLSAVRVLLHRQKKR